MKPQAWTLVTALALLVPHAASGSTCKCRFEVANARGVAMPLRRMTRTAEDGACSFDVRLRVAPGAETGTCDGAQASLRGLGRSLAVDPWAMGWERLRLRPHKHGVRRRVLRAKVRGADGAVGKARLALRCEAAPVLEGCEAVVAEPTYCVIGGAEQPRLVGLESGSLCRGGDTPSPAPQLQTPSLAVWHGEVWTCGGTSSPLGGFVATPLEGGKPRRVAGPCAATGTDGDTLLVLPKPGFETPASQSAVRRRSADSPAADRQILAYDLPDAVPDGPHRVAFDLEAIPEGSSPCGALLFDSITGQDGIIYAAGCRPGFFGSCTPQPTVCVFDTATGAMRPPLVLEDFEGAIVGLSAIAGGRLVVLTDDPTALPPIGYVSTPPPAGGGGNQLHVFDIVTGARLDSQTIPTAPPTLARGLGCLSH